MNYASGMSDVALDRGIYFPSTMTDWYRERPFKVAFVVSVLAHATLIAFIPGFRSVPDETPRVLEVQIAPQETPPPKVQERVVTPPKPVVTPPPSPPLPPKVEIRSVVQTEPVEWYVWAGIAALVLVAAAGGFAFGRKRSFARGLRDSDDQLDRMLDRGKDEQLARMLATTANVIREFESTPRAAPARREPPPRPVVSVPEPDLTVTDPSAVTDETPVANLGVPDLALDTQSMQPATEVDLHLESNGSSPAAAAPAEGHVAGLSNAVLFEMDQALDNTRSMFTDVDRFIALGRTQNALSLLQFQVHKDPKDRDSWIKLMAIYRQEKMDADLTRAAREFRSNFPNENPPAV